MLLSASAINNLSLAHADIMGEHHKRAGKLAQVHVVATPAAALTLIGYTNLLSATILELFEHRMKVQRVKTALDRAIAAEKFHGDQLVKNIDTLKELNISGKLEDRHKNLLGLDYDFHTTNRQKAELEIARLSPELLAAQQVLAQDVYAKTSALQNKLLPFLEQVRDQLGLSIDIEEYSRAVASVEIPVKQLTSFYAAAASPARPT